MTANHAQPPAGSTFIADSAALPESSAESAALPEPSPESAALPVSTAESAAVPASTAVAGPPEVLLGLVARLKQRGETLATAESLTGGMVGAALTDVPGVSAVYRGGVVVYATDLKATLAGVPADLLADVGPVHPDTAAALATGVRERLGATYGLATTGVAGPDPQAGIEAGTVYVAAAGPGAVRVRKLALSGDRAAVRQGSVRAVLELAAELVAEELA